MLKLMRRVRHAEIRRLALALREAARALKANRTELAAIVNDLVPELTTQPGIGPVSAAQAIVSFSHAGRCRNDAAFAKLAGTSPIEASSGQTSATDSCRGSSVVISSGVPGCMCGPGWVGKAPQVRL
jgi:transposase